MHRLIVTITAPNGVNQQAAIQAFANHLENVVADISALPPQNHSFGAFGYEGSKIHYRLELDDIHARNTAILPPSTDVSTAVGD